MMRTDRRHHKLRLHQAQRRLLLAASTENGTVDGVDVIEEIRISR
jgi:hypothetical protein